MRYEIASWMKTTSNVAAEPERPHVAFEVLALGVERAAEREHLGRDVGQRAVEARLQVRRVVPAARSELEQRPGVADRDVVDDAADERRLVPSSRTGA